MVYHLRTGDEIIVHSSNVVYISSHWKGALNFYITFTVVGLMDKRTGKLKGENGGFQYLRWIDTIRKNLKRE